jgi:transposase InsO family protein
LEGYRRLTFMMIDADVVYVSPSSVYRVLSAHGLLRRWNPGPSKKGQGFRQPLKPHEHWHVDVCYINICGTFYYLCSVLDGSSRYVVHWEIRTRMTEADVEIILQRAREKHPDENPRIITDNGPQFIAKDFKEFIRICGMTHVRTSPHYPQSNGKLERWHKSLKVECIRPKTPLSLEEGRRLVAKYVDHYNNVRLHSAIGYVAPKDKLEGREQEIFAERDRKIAQARDERRKRRAGVSQGSAIAYQPEFHGAQPGSRAAQLPSLARDTLDAGEHRDKQKEAMAEPLGYARERNDYADQWVQATNNSLTQEGENSISR